MATEAPHLGISGGPTMLPQPPPPMIVHLVGHLRTLQQEVAAVCFPERIPQTTAFVPMTDTQFHGQLQAACSGPEGQQAAEAMYRVVNEQTRGFLSSSLLPMILPPPPPPNPDSMSDVLSNGGSESLLITLVQCYTTFKMVYVDYITTFFRFLGPHLLRANVPSIKTICLRSFCASVFDPVVSSGRLIGGPMWEGAREERRGSRQVEDLSEEESGEDMDDESAAGFPVPNKVIDAEEVIRGEIRDAMLRLLRPMIRECVRMLEDLGIPPDFDIPLGSGHSPPFAADDASLGFAEPFRPPSEDGDGDASMG